MTCFKEKNTSKTYDERKCVLFHTFPNFTRKFSKKKEPPRKFIGNFQALDKFGDL